MLKVAITGNIASGKSIVEHMIRSKGFCVLDVDKVVHRLYDENLLLRDFVLNTFGTLDRAQISKVVFADALAMKQLENVIHPLIKEEVLKFININKDEKIIFTSLSQLYEAKMDNMYDKVILIVADDNIRLNRLMVRNKLSKDDAMLRINAQFPQDKKISMADYILSNNASYDELAKQLDVILADL